jgi:hypothetical protein
VEIYTGTSEWLERLIEADRKGRLRSRLLGKASRPGVWMQDVNGKAGFLLLMDD